MVNVYRRVDTAFGEGGHHVHQMNPGLFGEEPDDPSQGVAPPVEPIGEANTNPTPDELAGVPGAEEPVPFDVGAVTVEIEQLNVDQLKEALTARGVEGLSSKNKAELVALEVEARQQEAEGTAEAEGEADGNNDQS